MGLARGREFESLREVPFTFARYYKAAYAVNLQESGKCLTIFFCAARVIPDSNSPGTGFGCFGTVLGCLGTVLACIETVSASIGTVLACVGTVLVLFWTALELYCTQLELFWPV